MVHEWLSYGPRLIPAHAGKTSCGLASRDECGAHPRSRGENARSLVELLRVMGSSPLTRGKHVIRKCVNIWHGLIPAHAGKTFQAELEMIQDRAHPRSRGENRALADVTPPCGGSSPLTRGKHLGATKTQLRKGLIPAHAGKTARHPDRAHLVRAHPRSRGENRSASPKIFNAAGSSPLTRGKRARVRTGVFIPGLIPAHAGKTQATPEHTPRGRAHPRSRGENISTVTGGIQSAGSSPLTRGKPASWTTRSTR